MKTIACAILLALSIGAADAWAQAQPHNPNPTNDPDVQRGYEQHQQEHGQQGQQSQQSQQSQEQKSTNDNYTVNKSGDAHGGVPTGGAYPFSGIENYGEKK